MKKYEALKKKLTIEGSIAIAIVAVFLGMSLFTSGLSTEAERERRQAQVNLQTVKRDLKKATERLENSGASMELYENLKKGRDEMSLVISRRTITQVLGTLKNNYRLTSLSLQMDPEEPFENEELQAAKLDVVRSNVVLELGGMSDQHIYSFIKEMRNKLPGFIKVKRLELKREKGFDIETLQQISNGAAPQMVSGKLAFEWYGYPNEDQTVTQLDIP